VVPIPGEEIDPIETNVPSLRYTPKDYLSLYLVVVSVEETVESEVQKSSLDAVIQEYKGKLFYSSRKFS
jgi:hypothetical protein